MSTNFWWNRHKWYIKHKPIRYSVRYLNWKRSYLISSEEFLEEIVSTVLVGIGKQTKGEMMLLFLFNFKTGQDSKLARVSENWIDTPKYLPCFQYSLTVLTSFWGARFKSFSTLNRRTNGKMRSVVWVTAIRHLD